MNTNVHRFTLLYSIAERTNVSNRLSILLSSSLFRIVHDKFVFKFKIRKLPQHVAVGKTPTQTHRKKSHEISDTDTALPRLLVYAEALFC